MKVSVALCTFNGGRFIREQIESITRQTYLPHELIICDDGSQDDTVSIIKEIRKECPFPIILEENEERLGYVKNFEKAITLCSGDIISLCDQDDVWLERKIELTVAEFQRNDEVMAVFTDAEVVSDDLVSLGYTMFEHVGFDEDKKRRVSGGGAFELAIAMFFVTGMTLAFRRNLLPAIIPIPTHNASIIHDRWIAIIASAVGELSFVDVPLVRYRQHPKQQIGASSKVQAKWTIEGPNGERGFAHHAIAAKSLRLIEERTLALRRGDRRASISRILGPRIVHLDARARMDRPRLGRAVLILRELLSLRYFRYSSGLFSAAKDLAT